MKLFILAIFCLSFGTVLGALVENYRARVNWGFELGPEWNPPKDRRP